MRDVLKRHPLAWGLGFALGVPLLLFLLWILIASSYTYSQGDRAGYLQKLSRRGWLCKTWEGEIQMTANPGTVPERFQFTVRSDSIAKELSALAGKPVVVNYDQHKGLPGSCFGETEFFVVGVRPLTPR